MGYNMRPTGDIMTADMLRSIVSSAPELKGVAKDFLVVIKNLGRTSGRNQDE